MFFTASYIIVAILLEVHWSDCLKNVLKRPEDEASIILILKKIGRDSTRWSSKWIFNVWIPVSQCFRNVSSLEILEWEFCTPFKLSINLTIREICNRIENIALMSCKFCNCLSKQNPGNKWLYRNVLPRKGKGKKYPSIYNCSLQQSSNLIT